ncbi:MAG: inositol 2-dehydrogenase [Candidatus Zhuqueibacterota bacterium]
MKPKLDVGVIGLGRLGSINAADVAHRIPNANLLAVADIQEDRAKTFAHDHDVPRWYSSHQELIADPDVKAVVIVTPTSTHKEIVIEAAHHDKATFCEKPLSISLSETRKIRETIEKTGVFFQMGFQRRFDKGYVAARKKIAEGVIGDPIVLKASSRDPFRPPLEYADPKKSGGLIIDMAIHDFDVSRMFMGEVKSVYSVGCALAYPELKSINDIDNAIITMYFESGALGVVDVSRNGVYGYDIRAEILGTKGTIKVGYLRENPITILTQNSVAHDVVPYFMERFEKAYLDQIDNFVNNVLSGKEPPVTIADGEAALIISQAATISHHENRIVPITEIRESL